jgi:hypothetical protein
MTKPNEQQAAPERIYIHPADAEWHPNKWPLEESEYIEYMRVSPAPAQPDERVALERIYEAAKRAGLTKGRSFEEWKECVSDYGLDDARQALAAEQERAAARQPADEHRCPHFMPKGEDSDGAYNAGIISDVTKELVYPEDRNRLNAKPTAWYSLLIKQLIQRIANLRVMLAEARALLPQKPEEE